MNIFRNYIYALDRILQSGIQPTPLEYAHMLSDGMSQTTTNLIASLLHVQPRMLMVAQRHHALTMDYRNCTATVLPTNYCNSQKTAQVISSNQCQTDHNFTTYDFTQQPSTSYQLSYVHLTPNLTDANLLKDSPFKYS